KDDPTLKELTITPAKFAAKPGQEQQLKAEAVFSDGKKRDVTWLCKFESNDAGLAAVDQRGTVSVRRNGETSVRVSFQTGVSVVLVTAPSEKEVDRTRLATRNNFIDGHVFDKLAALRIEPSDLCSDAEFLRRAFLDTIGVLPTPDEVKAFLADTSAEKRGKLVDRLPPPP